MITRNLLRNMAQLLVLIFIILAYTPFSTASSNILQHIKKPLLFVANHGQFDDEVAFYANPMGLEVSVTKKGEIVYSLIKNDAGSTKITSFKESVVSSPDVKGLKGHQARFNYFIGNDKGKWKTNVPTYTSVYLGEAGEGIRLSLKAKEGNIEKLFYVSPKADPKDILIKTTGGALRINDNGELIIATDLGEITFTKPVAFQEINGKRVDVKVSYRLQTDAYGFDIGEYDKTRELIIDPLLASRFVGGAQDEAARAIASDGGGNIFIAGDTAGSGSFPKMPGGVYDCPNCNGGDITVSKFDPNLVMLASTFIGGNNWDWCDDIVINSDGKVYLIGSSMSSNFPMIVGAYQNALAGTTDVVVARFSNDLTTLEASTYLGGTVLDKAYKGALSNTGSLYITGETASSNFPTTTGVYQQTQGGFNDAFVSRLSPNLSSLEASTYLGKAGNDYGRGIVFAGPAAGVYVVGSTNSNNFTTGATNAYGAHGGGYDGFIAWLNSDLTTLNAARFIGGNGDDYAESVLRDGINDFLYISGYTNTTVANFDYTTGKFYGPGGGNDVFILNVNGPLDTIIIKAGIGGSGNESGMAGGVPIASDGSTIYVGGKTNSTDFPATTGAYSTTNAGSNDGFIAKFDSTLNRLAATYIGGTDNDEVVGLLFANSSVYACGETSSSNFPTTMLPAFGGVSDQFVLKFDQNLSAASANYTLTVTKAGSGSGSVNAVVGCTLSWGGAGNNTGTCSASGNVTLSGSHGPNSFFAGFTGAGCVGTSDCTINMNSDKYVTATFQTTGPGSQINIPKSGQASSYDSNTLKRDDGALRTGAFWQTDRFITGQPTGTVIDTLTGLMWMAAGNTPTIGSCSGGTKTWTVALDYVKCLNDSNYLGFSDWRMPNVNELASIYNAGESNNATWLNSNGFSNVPNSWWYWTSTTNTATTTNAIAITTDNGSIVSDNKGQSNYVIAVRTSSHTPVIAQVPRTGQTTSYDATRYGEDGDIQAGAPFTAGRLGIDPYNNDLVIDIFTGLKWPKAANTPTVGSCTGGQMTWQGAINYVNCLNANSYLGYNDWRLPNKNELRSLMYYGNANPALPAGHPFTGAQNDVYWTSTTLHPNMANAYTVNFSNGLLSNVAKTNSNYVLPVRGGFISVTVTVTGGGIVKTSDNTINCGSGNTICKALFDYKDPGSINLLFIPNAGKTLNSVTVNDMNIGPVHNLRIRSATHYVDVVAVFGVF